MRLSSGTSLFQRLRRWAALRPTLSVEALLLIGLAGVALGLNAPFWRAVLAGRDWAEPSNAGFAAAVFVLFVALHFLVLGLLATPRTVRPLLSVVIAASTMTAYFIQQYGVVLDPSMLRNVLATDVREAGELASATFAAALAVAAVLALLPWAARVRSRRWPRALLARGATLGAAAVMATAALLAAYQDLGSVMRNEHALRYLITPGNVGWSLAHVAIRNAQGAVAPREAPEPAVRVMRAAAGRKPTLFVLVIGETARAANFSLNGYARDTNPELARLDIVNFSDVTACGTSTEVSLPCMFSPFGRADYDEARIRRSESLLHLVARAGLRVVWLDNQSGCKGVCDGLETHDLSHATIDGLCADGRCLDEVLLHGLRDTVNGRAAADTVVVMHQLGNHGPAYFKRYPAELKRFEPACESQELRACSRAQIVNAYDNAILYTDRFLARTIAELQSLQARYDVALMYVSDHGESLGEHGLYLHGLPYAIAPREQTHVPMLWWMSPEAARSLDVNVDCLRRRAQAPASHDNLFHSVLGLLAVETPRYRPARDLFGDCRATRLVQWR